MKPDAINDLKSNLADLTYILHVIGKEFELIVQNTDDEKTKIKVEQTMSTLQDSNAEVVKLYHEINTNEEGIRNEWYNDDENVKGLQLEVDSLAEAINVILEGNRKFLNNNS